MSDVALNPPRTLASGDKTARLRLVQRALVLIAALFFLVTSFRSAWIHFGSDFGNYYTAAVLLRKKEPLRKYYDWTWFVRQMNLAGIDRQLGTYTTQTPLTMLPFVPLSWLPPQIAKRVWLSVNLILLVLTIYFLVRIAALPAELLCLLLFCGFYSLRTNFLYGQYYLFLLFLLTLTYFLLVRARSSASGAVAGIAFALKLYAGPLFLYFIATRKWKAAAAMLVATLCACVLAVSLFGWHDVEFYRTHVLERSLEGGSIDPYDAGNPAIVTLLHRLLRQEPELNPHPVADKPELFFFLRTFVNLVILLLVTSAVAVQRPRDSHRGFACFVIATLLVSTNIASYTYIILLLPVTLLWQESKPNERLGLVVLYFLLTAPLRPEWLFPKLWLLMLLLWYAGRPYWKLLPFRPIAALLIVIAGVSWLDARSRMRAYVEEPGRRFQIVPMQTGAGFASFPVPTHAGLFFQSLAGNRFVLGWFHDGRTEDVAFDGEALHPWAATPEGPIHFDLVRNGTFTSMEFDPIYRTVRQSTEPERHQSVEAETSPDGKWIAYTADYRGWEQVWLRPARGGEAIRLTGGSCSSALPAWDPESSAIIFASDCGRGQGLPVLYRAPVPVPTR